MRDLAGGFLRPRVRKPHFCTCGLLLKTPIEPGATPEAPMSRNLTAIIVTIACFIAAGLLLGLIIFLVFKLTGLLKGL